MRDLHEIPRFTDRQRCSMLVMILRRAPASLRGALSRWLIEPSPGAFLGNPSARVRDKLWQKAVEKARDGSVMQIWNYPCPQEYRYRQHGALDREFVDHEGLALVCVKGGRPHRSRKRPKTGG